jgi:hypothetical protein
LLSPSSLYLFIRNFFSSLESDNPIVLLFYLKKLWDCYL